MLKCPAAPESLILAPSLWMVQFLVGVFVKGGHWGVVPGGLEVLVPADDPHRTSLPT